jgi:hypothetical protein
VRETAAQAMQRLARVSVPLSGTIEYVFVIE